MVEGPVTAACYNQKAVTGAQTVRTPRHHWPLKLLDLLSCASAAGLFLGRAAGRAKVVPDVNGECGFYFITDIHNSPSLPKKEAEVISPGLISTARRSP
jgi:hypothetical protein